MLYIYTDPGLLGVSDVVPWHLSPEPFLAMRSSERWMSAFLGLRRDVIELLQRAVVPTVSQPAVTELVEINISFSLAKSKSGQSFVVGCPMRRNDVDIFLGLQLKRGGYPAIHDDFIPAFVWGARNSNRRSFHQLSYRNRKGSIVIL